MAVVALLLALQDPRIAEAVKALDADDPDARAAAVRTLIELEADLSEVAKSADGEKKLRAQEVVTAVALFKTAPGLRALWKSEPSRVPPALIAKLAGEPRDRWPDTLAPAVDGLWRSTREAVAADILADTAASQKFLGTLEVRLPRDVDWPPAPVDTWWFCLAALRREDLKGRQYAASLLGRAVAGLPEEPSAEIAAALLDRLNDKDRDTALGCAYALAPAARRFKNDRPRLGEIVNAVVERLADKDTNALWTLWSVNDATVQAAFIERVLIALKDTRPAVRSNAVSALYQQSLSPGPLVDAMARGLLSRLEDESLSVRHPAIYTLRDRAPHLTTDALLASSVRGFVARLDDPEAICREYAAGALAHVVRNADSARFGVLLSEAHAAVEARLKREEHEPTRKNLLEAAAELDKLAAHREAAIAKAKPGLDSDDIDTRSKAVRALIELDADVANGEVASAVRFFRTAPGCRQAWRLRSDVMPPPLIAKLAAAPRADWVELISGGIAPEAFTASVRSALAWELRRELGTITVSAMPWWCALAVLESRITEFPLGAATSLAVPPANLPDATLRDIAAAMVRDACVSELTIDARIQKHASAILAAWVADRAADDRRFALRVIRDFHPRGDDMNAIVDALAAATDEPDVELRRDILLTLEAKASYATGEAFDGAIRSLLRRLDDPDSDCRRHAARTLASLAPKLAGDLHRDVATAVDAALKREKHAGVRTWLEDAAAALKK